MLFDLRGAGRRNTVKAVYLLLALLMGVGLIGFGIGGAGLGGGLVDAITGSSGSSGTGADTFLKRAQAAQARAVATPKVAALWADAARARYQAAVGENFFDQNTQQFNDAGKAQLQIADEDWQKHLALNPNPPDDGAAGVMIKVYSPGALNELLAALSRRAQLAREVHPHMLRHCFPSNVLEAGGALDEAQALLGHASPASTQVYLHPSHDRLRQAVDRVAARGLRGAAR